MAVMQRQQLGQIVMDIGVMYFGKTLMDEVLQITTPRVVIQVQGQMAVMVWVGADGQWEQVAPEGLRHESPPEWGGQGEYRGRI